MYQSGKIYKIVSQQTEHVYIGSTRRPLEARLTGHLTTYRTYKPGDRGKKTTAFEIMQYPDAAIELIEDWPCEAKADLHLRERFHIESTPFCVNKVIPGRTRAEWNETTRDARLGKMSEYYFENKAEVLPSAKPTMRLTRK